MANRYDNGSVSRFNPMSLQEIMLIPAMQRQKHDQMLAQQEALTQGLAKVNPHNKYFEEASRLKTGLNDQISNQALQLSREGINSNSQADFLKLNREYQEMTSPTGKLGMINSHNVNLQTTYKNYIDEAVKAGQPPMIAQQHANLAMQKHMSEPLYDEKGRVVDFNAGISAPKSIDKIEWVNKLATNVGFDKKSWDQSSSALSTDGQNRFVVNSSAKGMSKDNVDRLNRLAERLNSEVSNPTSEIRQDIDYKFQDPKTELQGMLNQLYSKRERDSDSGRTDNIGSVDWKKIDEKTVNPNLNPVNVESVQISRNNDLLKNLNINDDNYKFSGISKGASAVFTGEVSSKPATTKKATLNSPEYKQLANNLVFSNRTLQGKRYDSKEVQDAVKNYLEKNKDVVIQNRYIDPNTDKTGLLFADKSLPADKEKASKLILERAQQGSYEIRDENGNVIPKDDLGKYNFTYSGDMTSKSKIGKKGNGIFPKPEQNIGTRRGLLYDPETKKSIIVYASRSSEDFKTPQFKAMKAINDITGITDSRPNIFNDVENPVFTKFGMKNVKVKYNSVNDTYELRYKNQDGIETQINPISSELFQKNILDDYNELQ